MAEAKRDANRVTSLLGVSNADDLTPVRIWADPSTHELLVKASVSITPSGTQDVNLTKVGGSAVALGQTTMASSIPVVLASNQTSIPVAATLAAETTKVIGTVNQGTSPWVVSLTSTTVTGTVAVTQSTTPWSDNISQINGITPLMGNGVTGTGSLRVTLASDNTTNSNPFAIKPTAGSPTLGDGVNNQITGWQAISGNDLYTTVMPFTFNGTTWDRVRSGAGTSTGSLRTVEANDVGRTLKSGGGSVASNGNNTLIVAGTNKLKVFAFSLSTTSTTAMTCIFQSGASGTELWRVLLQAGTNVSTGANLSVAVPGYLFSTAAATLLNLNISSANTIHWSASYFDEA